MKSNALRDRATHNAVTGKPINMDTLPLTPRSAYLPRMRLDELREKAASYAVNDAPVLAVMSTDIVALVDEVIEARARFVPSVPKRGPFTRLLAWLRNL